VHDEICRDGWNEGPGTVTEYYGSQTVDGSLLLLPMIGFLPINDRRIASIISTVFPQALTHLATVNTALALCGPTFRRGHDGKEEPVV
jgi:GH15 family glucan-1,4-alpha-glucosidase